MSEKDKNKGQKISARSARYQLIPFPLKTHDTATWRSSLKNHWKYQCIWVEKILILCKIYTPDIISNRSITFLARPIFSDTKLIFFVAQQRYELASLSTLSLEKHTSMTGKNNFCIVLADYRLVCLLSFLNI